MIPIAKPVLGEEECLAAAQAIRSGWITQGPRVKQFEEDFATIVGAKYACAVSNCTTALHMALLAAGVQAGDMVITASHSFIATANAVRMCHAEPVFVDIAENSYNIHADDIQQCVENDFTVQDDAYFYKHVQRLLQAPSSPLQYCKAPLGRLAAILIVHQVGMPADLEPLVALAEKLGIPLIEDAACASGSQVLYKGNWEAVGRPHGQAACFSFHPRKLLSTGDGGMISVNDATLDARFRLLRQHGMSVSDAVRHSASKVIFEEYVESAYNYRMTDIQAALGIEQLKRLEAMVIKRRELAQIYIDSLSGIADFTIFREPQYARTNWQTFLIHLHDAKQQLPFMQYMLDKGIATRRGIMCAHKELPYAQAWSDALLPRSAMAQECSVALPLFMQMTEQEQENIITAIRKFF